MALPEDLPWSSPQEGARLVALELLGEARQAAERLDRGNDSEALHDFRVAVRRLRSLIRAWRPELRGAVKGRHRRALSAFQEATNAGRDAEVALEWIATQSSSLRPEHLPGFEWLDARLCEHRSECQTAFDNGLRGRFESVSRELGKRLAVLEVKRDLRRRGREVSFVERLAEQTLIAGKELGERIAAIDNADDEAAIHRARIAGKRLRYLLEPVRAHCDGARRVVKRCRGLQDELGDLNDAYVLGRELDEALEASSEQRAARVRSLAHEGLQDRARREAWFTEWPGLLELMQRLALRRGELFDRLRRDWLNGGIEELLAEIEAAAAELRALGSAEEGIERTFLLERLPPLDGLHLEAIFEIDEGWLPGKQLQERLRRLQRPEGPRFFRTVKLGRGPRRAELEEETTAEVFGTLWPLTEGARLRKRRYRVSDGELAWELEEFLNRELVLAKVELTDRSANVELPSWLKPHVAREVTGDAGFSGKELAKASKR